MKKIASYLENILAGFNPRGGVSQTVAMISLGLALTWTQGFSRPSNNAASAESVLQYRSYNEAEIKSAVSKPLTLEDCVGIALSKNITLQIAREDYYKAEVSHSGTYGIFYPVLSVGGLKERTEEDRSPVEPGSSENLTFDRQSLTANVAQLLPTGATLNLSSDIRSDLNSPDRFGAPPTRTRNRQFSVSLTQPLLRDAWPTVVRSAISTTEYDRIIQDRELFDTNLQTVYQVKQAFYEVLLQKALVRLNEAAIVRDSTLVWASESKVEAKLATRRDVLSAEIQLAEDKVKLIKSQTDLRNSLSILKEVLGLPIGLPIEIADVELTLEPLSLDVERLIQQATENNPLIHSTNFAIERSRLQLKVAKNSRLPRLDFVGAYEGSFESDTDQNVDLNTAGWEVSFNLSYPLMNREAAATTEVAEIDIAQQQRRLHNLQRQLEVNIRNIVRNISSSMEELRALELSIEAAEEKVAFATTMFNMGRASNFDITDAQEALLKNQTEYARNLVEYHSQLALLETFTGQPIGAE